MTSKPRGIMGCRDPSRIDIGVDHEVAYWAIVLGVSELNLVDLVGKVGDSVRAIRLELGELI